MRTNGPDNSLALLERLLIKRIGGENSLTSTRPKLYARHITRLKRIGGHSIEPKTQRQRRNRQSVTAKREKSQTPKFVLVRLGQVRLS